MLSKLKDKFHRHRSRSRSPSLRNGSSQSLPNVHAIVPAPSGPVEIPQNGPVDTAEDHQSRHSLAIPTINEPAPEQEPIVEDPPIAEAGDDDDEEGKPAQTPSDEIWDCAYDELKVEEPALVQAYEKILTARLLSENDTATEAIAEVNCIDQHDKVNRKSQMQQLVKLGSDKISRETKAKSRIGDVLPIVNLSKNIVTEVVKGVPQAALPWAAVSISLELLTNPISETKANSTGVKHVTEQMNWYCELAMLLFGNQDGITAGMKRELRAKLIDLYKKLLSFEIKSICSYYRHRGLVFLGDLIKLDDWRGIFKEVQDAEAFFNEQLRTFQSVDIGQDVKQLVIHAKNEQTYRQTDEDKKCLRDLHVTDPRMDKTRIETTKGGLVQDSWRWILKHPDYQTWLHDDDKRLLWVKGDPGKGKTMLLCGLVDEITTRVGQSGSAISYFFCQATTPTINNHLAVLRGLIWLLTGQQPSLISHVREKYDSIGKDLFEGPNAWYSLTSIFRNILHDARLTTTYVIIDGLDECTTGLSELLELVKEVLPLQNVKWILSSRNWPEIQASLEDTPDAEGVNLSLEVNATVVAAAVDAYISEKASKVKLFKRNDKLREDVCNVIREKANGTFLWVAIVFQQLQRMKISFGGLPALMNRLNELPKDLTELYDRMLQQIEDLDSIEESSLCRTVLGICVVAYQPLRLQELATLAGFKDEIAGPSELRILIETCGSFLTVKDETVYFIHQSSEEYLTTNSRAQSALFTHGTKEIHHKMAMHSVDTMGKVLCRDVYKLQDHAILIDDITTPEPDPLLSLRYSCSNWLRHLCISMARFDLRDGRVLEFLKEHLLHWLEVVSLMRNSHQVVADVIHFEGLLQQHYPDSELLHLLHDMRRFTQHNSWIINNAPLQIYLSAILFTPKLSIVRSLFEEELLSWITVKPFVERHWGPCLQTIEIEIGDAHFFVLSTDGKMLATSSDSNSPRLWDVNSGKRIHTLNIRDVRQIAYSKDSKHIFAIADNDLVFWDVDSGKEHRHTWSPGAWPTMSNDGKFIASRTINGRIQIQDMDTGNQLYLVQDHLNYETFEYEQEMKLSNDAKFLAFSREGERVTIWDVQGNAENTVIDTTRVNKVCFSSDSTLMGYRAYYNGRVQDEIKIWNLVMRREVRTIPTRPISSEEEFRTFEFSTDFKLLAGGVLGGSIMVWDVGAGTRLTQLDFKGEPAYSLSWSQDCKILASASVSNIQVWDMTTLVEQEPVPGVGPEMVEAIAVSNDSKLVATRSSADVVKVWDITTGSELRKFETGRKITRFAMSPNSTAFSRDSKFIYTSGDDSVVKWDIDLGIEVTDSILLSENQHWRYGVFSLDGSLYTRVTASGHVTIWDVSTGRETVRCTVGDAHVEAMAFSNNAQYLCISFEDESFGVWEVVTGDRIKHAKGHVCVMTGERGCSRCNTWIWYHGVAVSNNARRVIVGYSLQYENEIWIHNEGQKIIRLSLEGQGFETLFAAGESYITTWGGRIDLNGLQTGCETLDSYQTITLEEIRFEGYGLSADKSWITWNGSNILWLPGIYRPHPRGNSLITDRMGVVTILPLGLFIVVDERVVIIGFSGPPPR
ncbi:hypothetical protein CCMA1212_001361 [Trichoderma ghanense]|uniref:NACHT domain-containing protein n=1 Tax=Trichoderma ghanense TaxID=65468 RepID=A0ABY2HF38_9HYPO